MIYAIFIKSGKSFVQIKEQKWKNAQELISGVRTPLMTAIQSEKIPLTKTLILLFILLHG